MNEYADKLHVQPTYDTVQEQLGGVLRVFKTSLVFNGTSYTGDPARTKKEAEQSAAKAAILSIMGDSTSGTTLIEIIKSKSTFYDAIKGKGPPLLQPSAVLSTTNTGQISVTLGHRDTGVTASVLDNNNNNKNIEAKVEFPESSKMLSTCQELQMIKQESSLEANNVSLQPGSEHSIDNSSTSKKRKKNKKKSNNKKLRLETPPLPITAVSLNQVPPCTAVLINQVPPCSAVPMNQVPPFTAVPMSQVPP
ncbi:double-stranded RNA-binding protein 4 isoform X2 [Glycine max]|nr:double-stranded RNA-binding protein 4 isoform X2 [Glycine max]